MKGRNDPLPHSDLSVLDGTIPFPTPVVCGHEGAGIVEEIGSAVSGVAPGDHVVVSTLANCGRCPACAAGYPTRCRASIGNITQPFTFRGEPAYNFAATSSFAERIVVEAVQAVPIAREVPFTSAAEHRCQLRFHRNHLLCHGPQDHSDGSGVSDVARHI